MSRILTHLDDVGSSAGSVIAWKALREAGTIRSASLMVPCPYYPMARDDWHSAPDQCMGVHITLTSEWSSYRWRPLIGGTGGLVDDEGYMHRRPDAVIANADPSAVADEIEAQIGRALADGIRPTHLDAHMGTALFPPFVWTLIEAGRRHAIPVLACHDLSPLTGNVRIEGLDHGFISEVTAEVAACGWPVFDRFVIGFCPDEVGFEDYMNGLLDGAAPGLNYYALHADTAEGMEHFAPHHKAPRARELAYYSDPASRALFEARGADVLNWKEL